MIHIICALICEAKSLLTHYQLKQRTDSVPFPLYISKDEQISLTISGIGKINSAAATAYTHAYLQTRKQDVWLNVGIAGHRNMEIGEAVLAHKVIDNANQHVWYPQIIFTPSCQSGEVLSCDIPTTEYESPTLSSVVFEMEAAGFYATACRFATNELIHVFKIISDNQQQPANKIGKSFVSHLVKNQLPCIDLILTLLERLSEELEIQDEAPDYYKQIIDQWRFTHAERMLLRSCLNRWHVLCPDENPMNQLADLLKSKDVIHQLTTKLDNHPVNF